MHVYLQKRRQRSFYAALVFSVVMVISLKAEKAIDFSQIRSLYYLPHQIFAHTMGNLLSGHIFHLVNVFLGSATSKSQIKFITAFVSFYVPFELLIWYITVQNTLEVIDYMRQIIISKNSIFWCMNLHLGNKDKRSP